MSPRRRADGEREPIGPPPREVVRDPVTGKRVSRSAQIAADRDLAPADAGSAIVAADLVGTAALALVTLVTALVPDTATEVATVAVSGVLFVGGCATFAVGFVRAAGRSRYEVLDLAGLYYLTGSAPDAVRRRLLGLWYAQMLIAVASIFVVHPPFGVLAVVWGIGLNALWSARHGAFPARPGVRRA